MKKPELTEEDQQRVKDYLAANPLHNKERQPFRLFTLLGFLVLVVALMALFSYLVGKYYFYAA